MSFDLFEDRIAILADEESDVTKGGIVLLPDSQGHEQMRFGTVAVVGHGHRGDRGDLIPIDVKVGDRVFWNRHSGSEIEVEDVKYIFLASREIVGAIKK